MTSKGDGIVTAYARMWPRAIFGKSKKWRDEHVKFLDTAGVYVLYKDESPYYIGQAQNLRRRLYSHAVKADSRYFLFWNFFSVFTMAEKHINELEGILIAAMPTANSSRPQLAKEKMPRAIRDLLGGEINQQRMQ